MWLQLSLECVEARLGEVGFENHRPAFPLTQAPVKIYGMGQSSNCSVGEEVQNRGAQGHSSRVRRRRRAFEISRLSRSPRKATEGMIWIKHHKHRTRFTC